MPRQRVEVVGGQRFAAALRETVAVSSGPTIDKALLAAAFVLEAAMKTKAAVDTGALRNSIYSANNTESNYSKRRAEATAAGDGSTEILPEQSVDRHEAIVAVGAEYGVHVEYGTSRMTARPFVRAAFAERSDDALEAARRVIERAMP